MEVWGLYLSPVNPRSLDRVRSTSFSVVPYTFLSVSTTLSKHYTVRRDVSDESIEGTDIFQFWDILSLLEDYEDGD